MYSIAMHKCMVLTTNSVTVYHNTVRLITTHGAILQRYQRDSYLSMSSPLRLEYTSTCYGQCEIWNSQETPDI